MTVKAHHHILGFGPGGVSFFVAADRLGLLQETLRQGVVVHEAQSGLGQLLRTGLTYDIVSNSYARDFIDEISPSGVFADVANGPLGQMFRDLDREPVPLTMVATLIQTMRETISRLLRTHPNCDIRFADQITRIVKAPGHVTLRGQNGESLHGNACIFATGSAPHVPRAMRDAAQVLDVPMMHADALLRPNGLKHLPRSARRLTIVGGSHSAFSVANKIINGGLIEDLHITLLHRDPIRRMFLSESEARSAGEAFDPNTDVCPDSGRVFRFQGLYTRSKDLYEQIRAGQHKTITFKQLPAEAHFEDAFVDADVIIASTGYEPRLPQISRPDGSRVLVGRNGSAVLVDERGRLCSEHCEAFDGLYGLGLGFGRRQDGLGEPSYNGAPVGVNFFQGPDGAAICRDLQETSWLSFAHAGKEAV